MKNQKLSGNRKVIYLILGHFYFKLMFTRAPSPCIIVDASSNVMLCCVIDCEFILLSLSQRPCEVGVITPV